MNQPPKKSILIVDDHESLVTAPLCKFFGRASWTAVGALNGRECMEQLQQQRFDVVLLDIRMPGEDGLSVLKKIVGDYPSICVIMFSAFDTPDHFRRAFQSGAWDFLSKPMDPVEIVAQVDVQLGKFLESRSKDDQIASFQVFFNFCRALSHGQKNRMDPMRVWVNKLAGENETAARREIVEKHLRPLFDDTNECLNRFEIYARFEAMVKSEIAFLTFCRDVAARAVKRFKRTRWEEPSSIICEGENAPVKGDPAVLGEIVDNFFSNALEASPPQSTIIASVRREGPLVVLRVEDEGSGFDSLVIDHIGETVVTTKKTLGGFGVGLLMAARIAKQLGGHLTAGNHKDRPGAWIEFSIQTSS